MKSYTRKLMSFGLSLLALAVLLVSNAAPARAAGSTILVDDDGLNCRNAVPTIQQAISQAQAMPSSARKKIVVCAGTYTGPFLISDMSNLSLVARKNVTLVPPNPSPFEDHLLMVRDSRNVTVQGFTVDGRAMLGAVFENAIYYQNSSGLIQKNTIVNWRTFDYTQANNQIAAIFVNANTQRTVRILKNTIRDSQSRGIYVEGPVTVTVSKNRITAVVTGTNNPSGISAAVTSLGVVNGVISGNTLYGGAFPGAASRPAISAYEVGPFQIKSNTITGWSSGIDMSINCAYSVSSMDNLVVRGNKLTNNDAGILLVASASACSTHANNLQIRGNKITNMTTGTTAVGLWGTLPGPMTGSIHNAVVKGNTITNFHDSIVVYGDVTGVFTPNRIH